jgi:tetratricopeptide (TPR) repeat protein
MFVAGAAMGALTGYMERWYVGAIGPDFQFTHLQRLCIAGRVVWFYLWKLLWPTNLSFIYRQWTMNPELRPWLILFAAAWAGCCGALWLLRKKIGRGPLTAALFFVGTLVPALGFVNVMPMSYSFVADHFQYLAGIGPVVLVVALVWGKLPREIGMVVLGMLVVILGIVSFARCSVYHDLGTLWKDAETKNPDGLIVLNNLGYELLDEGDADGAEARARKIIELYPADPSRGQLLLGAVFASRGDNLRALDYYQQAEKTMPDHPEPILHAMRFTPFFQEGIAYKALADAADRTDPAAAAQYRALGITAFREAAKINPYNDWCFIRLGGILTDADRETEANQIYAGLIKANPDSIPAWVGMGNAYFKMQKYEFALTAYGRALRIQPDNMEASVNIGMIYGAQSKWDSAIAAFRAALRIDPKSPAALNGLQRAQQAKDAGH